MCCKVFRVPVENYDGRLYIQTSKPRDETTATTTTTTNDNADLEIQKKNWRERERERNVERDSEQRK